MRHAVNAWEENFSNKLKKCGVAGGEASPVVLSNLQVTSVGSSTETIPHFLRSRISCVTSRRLCGTITAS